MGMGSGGPGVVPTSMSSSGMGGMGRPATSSAAGPTSGNRYGGFGSEDIARLGFNQENKFNAPYDPYTKGQSAPSMQTHAAANSRTGAASARLPETSDKKKKSKKSKKNKKKAKDSYDSESDDDNDDSDDSDDSDDDSDEDSDDKKKKAKRNKRKKRQLGKAPKSSR